MQRSTELLFILVENNNATAYYNVIIMYVQLCIVPKIN